jgi:hypothetical protein
MLSFVTDRLLDYLRRQAYWSKLEPVLLVALLYAAALVLTYQYIQWRYHYAPEVFLFLRSYLARQVTVSFVALALAAVALIAPLRRVDPAAPSSLAARFRDRMGLRIAALVVIAALASLAWAATLPKRTVDDVRILLHTATGRSADLGFDRNALTYLVYELNRQQDAWHYEIDTELFDEAASTHAAHQACARHPVALLCLAGAWAREAGAGQLILISGQSLGELGAPHYYWSHAGGTSLVSTADWRGFPQPSVYEYLAYSIIQQTIRIHLDIQCGLLSEKLEREADKRGGLFEYMPDRELMRARLLSAQLGSRMEETLFNCFGPDYTVNARRLLTLDWLREGQVQKNLERVYDVKLSAS